MSATPSLRSEYRDDCLVIHLHGRAIFEKMEATVQAIADTIKARPVHATLLDLRKVPGPVTFMDRYNLGEIGARHLVGKRIALLVREEQADRQRIGLLTARNRGATAELFTDPAEAETWLKKTTATDHQPPDAPP